jgi:hypothetical protein
MISFSLDQLQQLTSAAAGVSFTQVQQQLHLQYLPEEVTVPSVPVVESPQTIASLRIGSAQYTNSRAWNSAWLTQFESNIQAGVVRRQTRYRSLSADLAHVVTAEGLALVSATLQPVITPTGQDTTTIIELAPQRGAQGEPGPGVIAVSVNELGNLIVTYEDQSTTDAGYVIGPPPVITTGPTTTVDYGEGSSVTVTNPVPGTYNLAFTVERSDPTNPTLTGVGTLNGRRIATQPDVIAFNLAF